LKSPFTPLLLTILQQREQLGWDFRPIIGNAESRKEAKRECEFGFSSPQFRAPSQADSFPLTILVHSPIGDDRIDQTVTVEEAAQILLTTDKPIYQPSQTIHIRALCLHKPELKPAANLPCTFEVRDPKGNIVFRAVERTSKFGIAATQFPIADEVTLGEYRITATLHGTGDARRGRIWVG